MEPERNVDPGVDVIAVNRKLPKEIDPALVNNGTFAYTDPVEMIEDMKRLRRRTGWVAFPMSGQPFTVFHLIEVGDLEQVEKERFAHFEIELKVAHQRLWPSLYPGNPAVHQLRRWWMEDRNGLTKIATMVNEIPKEEDPLPEEASVWHRLLHDEDPF